MIASTAEDRSPRGIWRQAWASALNTQWRLVEPVAALRCTLGVAIPLLAALALGQPAAASFIAVGAVSAGFGSFQGAYRSRALTMVLDALGMAFSLFVGSIAGHSVAGAVLAAAVWGLSAGLLVAVGPGASFVGLQSAVAM